MGAIQILEKTLYPVKATKHLEFRSAAFVVNEDMNRPQRHRVRTVTFSHGHHIFIYVEAYARWGSKTLVSISASPELGQGRKNLQSLRQGCHGADIIREQAISLAMKLGSQRGLASTLDSNKDHRAPGRLYRASMKRKQSALVKQRAQG